MRFALTTALIVILCGLASFTSAMHGDGDLFVGNWWRAAALLFGLASALSAGASAVRFVVFAATADIDAEQDAQRLGLVRTRTEAQTLDGPS